MIKDNEPLGDLVRCLLIHMKCIEVRMKYSTHQFKGDSKYKIGGCINKVKKAIDGICDLANNPEAVRLIQRELERADLVYHMVLAEQMYNATEQTLREVTDLIDEYLIKKENEEKLGEGNSSED